MSHDTELSAAIQAALRHRGSFTVALARLDGDLASVVDHQTGTVYIDDREPVAEALADAVRHLAPRLRAVPCAAGDGTQPARRIPRQSVTSVRHQRSARQLPLVPRVRSEATSDDGG